MHPNPTMGVFYIDGDVTKLKGVNIYWMTGQHVMGLKGRFRKVNIFFLTIIWYILCENAYR